MLIVLATKMPLIGRSISLAESLFALHLMSTQVPSLVTNGAVLSAAALIATASYDCIACRLSPLP